MQRHISEIRSYEKIPTEGLSQFALLCYQKASFSYHIGENKGTNTMDIISYFKKILQKYSLNEDQREVLTQIGRYPERKPIWINQKNLKTK